MVKTEEHDYDVFSDDGFLWKEIGPSSAHQSTCSILAKEVKLEDDDDSGSFGDVFVYGNTAQSNSKPISSSSQVKQESNPSSFPHYLRSSFIAMGFSSALVDKIIKENGDQDGNMLLEILIRNSQSSPQLQQSSPQSSDSWGQFSTGENIEKEEKSPIECTTEPKQEFEVLSKPSSTGWIDKRSSLATMGFPDKDIDLAISRLGVNASLAELVDFIVASQTSNSSGGNEENEECVTAKLFSTMDKTLCLLQMGFTENEVSFAIETLGPEVPVGVLAESIFSKRMSFAVNKKEEDVWEDIPDSFNQNRSQIHLNIPEQKIHKRSNPWTDPWPTQAPNPNPNDTWIRKDPWTTKAPNLDPNDGWIRKESTSNPFPTNNYNDDDVKAIKKPKPTNNKDKTTSCSKTPYDWDWNEDTNLDTKPDQHAAVKEEFPYTRNTSSKLPYFFYANTIDVSQTTWQKLSQFLYISAPEFTNPQFFSALYRKEGYLHNLPTENRSHIVPKPPMIIEEALPFTKKWWPSWDTRKQLSCISSDTTGTAQLCDRLSKMMSDSQGFLTKEQQIEIIHHCKKSNLIWAGLHQLSPVQPTHIETILGYPENHTQILNLETEDRLRLLRDAIQVHTLGYHISVLKNMFPDGVRVLSVFTGVGGAVIALHRLGVWLKCVVSVEERECNRKILKRWWQETEQCGELRQIKGIDRLTSQTIEGYMELFGGFDVVIGCNPGDWGGEREMNLGLFFEFVRVFQRVRSMMGRNS